jgi:hypothetical protein
MSTLWEVEGFPREVIKLSKYLIPADCFHCPHHITRVSVKYGKEVKSR